MSVEWLVGELVGCWGDSGQGSCEVPPAGIWCSMQSSVERCKGAAVPSLCDVVFGSGESV